MRRSHLGQHCRDGFLTEKVFVIGFQKTGTTSLGAALEQLGYHLGGGFRVNHPRGVPIQLPITQEKLADAARSFALRADAFEDNPWPIVFREMDKAFPGSKFILTRRDPGSWITSMVRHFGDAENPMRSFIFGAGCPLGNETTYVCRYQRHIDEVLAYFAHRPEDLLIMNLEKPQWSDICGFLDKPIPSSPFPHKNSAVRRERPIAAITTRLKRLIFKNG